MKNLRWFVHLFVAMVVIVILGGSAAQNTVPILINYQGELRSPTTGEPVPDGSYDIVFRIYNVESGGTALWQGTHSIVNGNPVEVTDAIFNVILGSGNGNALDASVFDGADKWLEIEVETETLSPRQRITSVPYSMVSATAADIAAGAKVVGSPSPGTPVFWTVNEGSGGVAVQGEATDAGDVTNYGGYFTAAGEAGAGVYGRASGSSGAGVCGEASHEGDVTNYGGYFTAEGQVGAGVYGGASGTSGAGVEGEATDEGDVSNYGGYFTAAGKTGTGVYGEGTGSEGAGIQGDAPDSGDVTNYGGYFTAAGTTGVGAYGEAYGSSGVGIVGIASDSPEAYAGYFEGDVHVDGVLTATSKTFVHPHPTEPGKQIVYVCLEGGENGVYVRGNGKLENGRAEIDLPEHFGLVAAQQGLTAHVTPRDAKAQGYLCVEEVSPDRVIVAESGGGTSDARFDYLVMGVRRGFEEHEAIQENKLMKPARHVSQEKYENRMALPKRRGMQKLLVENGTLTTEGRINQETARRLGWKLGPKTKGKRPGRIGPQMLGADRKTR